MLSSCAKMYVIWLKPNGEIYHRLVSGHYTQYQIGYINSYGHEVIYIIDDIFYRYVKPPFKLRFKRKLIKYIEKM